MEKGEIFQKVKKSICKVLNIDVNEEEIKDDALLYDDLGIDSVDNIDLVVELEDVFKIELPTSSLSYMKSVDTIVNQVQELLNKN